MSWRKSFTALSTDVDILFLSVSKKRGIERIPTVSFFYKWQKFNKKNEKRSLWYHSVGAEYVTERIYSLMQLLLRRFTAGFLHHLKNFNLL